MCYNYIVIGNAAMTVLGLVPRNLERQPDDRSENRNFKTTLSTVSSFLKALTVIIWTG